MSCFEWCPICWNYDNKRIPRDDIDIDYTVATTTIGANSE